jgi:hypothetical protein
LTAVLDEGVPERLARSLAEVGCRVLRFPDEWRGLKNGRLIERMRAAGIDCLVTCDKNFQHQQDVVRHGISLVVLPRQRLGDLLPILSEIAAAIDTVWAGQVIVVSNETRRSRG